MKVFKMFKMPRQPIFSLLLIGIALFFIIRLLLYYYPDALQSADDKAYFIYTLLLVTLSASLWPRLRQNLPQFFKYALIWLCLGLAFLIIYSFRYEIIRLKDRLIAEVFPSSVVDVDERSAQVTRALDGHFYIQAHVNGRPLRFLVDTGASRVVLTKNTAEKMGINIQELRYTDRSYTANGVVATAPITIESLRVGPIVLNDVRASVSRGELHQSLLGMSFFERLSRYVFEGNKLTLWK